MLGETRREAERPPWFAVIGTIIVAPLFGGAVMVLGPYLLSGWKLDAPFLGWAPSRWIGGALVILPIPPLLDFLVRFVREGHGTPAPFAHRGASLSADRSDTCAIRPTSAPYPSSSGRDCSSPARACSSMQPVVALAFHLFVVLYEEPTLRATFGADYVAYCREVPRWIRA